MFALILIVSVSQVAAQCSLHQVLVLNKCVNGVIFFVFAKLCDFLPNTVFSSHQVLDVGV